MMMEVPTAPELALRALMIAGTTKFTPALDNPETVTTTLPVVAPKGTVATMLAPLQELTVATVLLKVTELVVWVAPKFDPLMIIEVPTAPKGALRAVMAGVVDSVEPVEPVEPDEPLEPVEAVEPVAPVEPVLVAQPASPHTAVATRSRRHSAPRRPDPRLREERVSELLEVPIEAKPPASWFRPWRSLATISLPPSQAHRRKFHVGGRGSGSNNVILRRGDKKAAETFDWRLRGARCARAGVFSKGTSVTTRVKTCVPHRLGSFMMGFQGFCEFWPSAGNFPAG
jgi:hypothetical protein